MKRLSIVVFSVFMLASCKQNTPKEEVEKTAKNGKILPLAYLEEFNGKYPNDVKLFETNPLNLRLKDMFSDEEKKDFFDNFQTETPIKVDNNGILISACRQNNCDTYKAALFIDVKKDEISFSIIDDSTSIVGAEVGNTPNKILNNWTNEELKRNAH